MDLFEIDMQIERIRELYANEYPRLHSYKLTAYQHPSERLAKIHMIDLILGDDVPIIRKIIRQRNAYSSDVNTEDIHAIFEDLMEKFSQINPRKASELRGKYYKYCDPHMYFPLVQIIELYSNGQLQKEIDMFNVHYSQCD